MTREHIMNTQDTKKYSFSTILLISILLAISIVVTMEATSTRETGSNPTLTSR